MHSSEFEKTETHLDQIVVVHYIDQAGSSRQRRLPLTNLAAFILNSVKQSTAVRDPEMQDSH